MLHWLASPKARPKFFPNGASGVYFKFLSEVGDVQTSRTNDFSRRGFNLPCNNFELGGFACTIDPDKTNAIAHFHFPVDILEDFASGVNFTDMFESQHYCVSRTDDRGDESAFAKKG
jgi:hypothetical protein